MLVYSRISCLSVASFAIIFSHSEGCLFTSLIVSFDVGVRPSHSLACGKRLSLFIYMGKGSESSNMLPASVLFHGGI